MPVTVAADAAVYMYTLYSIFALTDAVAYSPTVTVSVFRLYFRDEKLHS